LNVVTYSNIYVFYVPLLFVCDSLTGNLHL